MRKPSLWTQLDFLFASPKTRALASLSSRQHFWNFRGRKPKTCSPSENLWSVHRRQVFGTSTQKWKSKRRGKWRRMKHHGSTDWSMKVSNQIYHKPSKSRGLWRCSRTALWTSAKRHWKWYKAAVQTRPQAWGPQAACSLDRGTSQQNTKRAVGTARIQIGCREMTSTSFGQTHAAGSVLSERRRNCRTSMSHCKQGHPTQSL